MRTRTVVEGVDTKRCEQCGRVIRRRRNCSRAAFARRRFCGLACAGAAIRGLGAAARRRPGREEWARNRGAEAREKGRRDAGVVRPDQLCPHCRTFAGRHAVQGWDGREELWCARCLPYAPRTLGVVVLRASVGTAARGLWPVAGGEGETGGQAAGLEHGRARTGADGEAAV